MRPWRPLGRTGLVRPPCRPPHPRQKQISTRSTNEAGIHDPVLHLVDIFRLKRRRAVLRIMTPVAVALAAIAFTVDFAKVAPVCVVHVRSEAAGAARRTGLPPARVAAGAAAESKPFKPVSEEADRAAAAAAGTPSAEVRPSATAAKVFGPSPPACSSTNTG